MVEQQMQLDRPLGAAEMSPVEHFQAEVNSAGINAEQRILESKPLLTKIGQGLNLGQGLMKDGFEELPGTVSVGISQGRFLGRRRKTQVVYLAPDCGQAAGYLPQGIGPGELGKKQGNQLGPG